MAKSDRVRELRDGSLLSEPQPQPQRETEVERVKTQFPDALPRDPNQV